MISMEDCVAMCGLEVVEIEAIAEHEHLPEIAAAALANLLLHRPGGECVIRRMLVDDIRRAIRQQRLDHVTELVAALRRFVSEQPGAIAETV
jgi:hypothetical protein